MDCEGGTQSERSKNRFFRLEKRWRLFSGIVMELSYSIIFKKEKNITGIYYASLFDKLKAEIAQKRSHLLKKKCSPRPFHTSVINNAKIPELRFKLLDHLTLLTRSSTKRVPTHPPKLEVALGGQIFIRCRGHRLRKQLFCTERR